MYHLIDSLRYAVQLVAQSILVYALSLPRTRLALMVPFRLI